MPQNGTPPDVNWNKKKPNQNWSRIDVGVWIRGGIIWQGGQALLWGKLYLPYPRVLIGDVFLFQSVHHWSGAPRVIQEGAQQTDRKKSRSLFCDAPTQPNQPKPKNKVSTPPQPSSLLKNKSMHVGVFWRMYIREGTYINYIKVKGIYIQKREEEEGGKRLTKGAYDMGELEEIRVVFIGRGWRGRWWGMSGVWVIVQPGSVDLMTMLIVHRWWWRWLT